MERIYKLTKQEIGDAIVNYIGIFKEGKSFFPYRIKEVDSHFRLTNYPVFILEHVPKVTKCEEAEHGL